MALSLFAQNCKNKNVFDSLPFSLPSLFEIMAWFLAQGEGKKRKTERKKKRRKEGKRKRWQEGRKQGRKEFLIGRTTSVIHFLICHSILTEKDWKEVNTNLFFYRLIYLEMSVHICRTSWPSLAEDRVWTLCHSIRNKQAHYYSIRDHDQY